MSRRHSSIELGAGGLVYTVTAALILGAAVFTQANLLFWAFGLMVGVLVVSLAISAVALGAVDVRRQLPQHAVAGQPAPIGYLLHNRSWLPVFGLVIQEVGPRSLGRWLGLIAGRDAPEGFGGRPSGWVLHLGARQRVQAEALAVPMRRGPIQLHGLTLTTGFPFGVLRKTVTVPLRDELLVLPRLYRLRRGMLQRLAAGDPAGLRSTERRGGRDEFYGVREYRSGDPLRTIDWKRTARLGQFMSREMTQPDLPQVMIRLDLRDPGNGAGDAPASAEDAISLTASLVCAAYLEGYPTGLMLPGASAPALRLHHSLPHRRRMLEALARLNPQPVGGPGPGGRASIVVWRGPSQSGPLSRRGGAAVVGAADLSARIEPGDTSALLSQRSRGTPRWAQRAGDAAVAGGGAR